jgi:hypothetical protein
LTAGHVAHGSKTITDASGRTTVGTTQAVLYPGATTSGTPPNVDVALISTTAVVTKFLLGGSVSGSAAIDLYLKPATKSDSIVGMISWYVFPGVGNYIDVYMTSSRCTNPGDSGAGVTAAKSNDVLGIVVGGTTGTFTSFVQDINSQLKALKHLRVSARCLYERSDMPMLNIIAAISCIFSIICFLLYVYQALARMRTTRSQIKGESAELHGGVADMAKLIEAFSKLSDSLEKAGPMTASLIGSMFFIILAMLAAGFGK